MEKIKTFFKRNIKQNHLKHMHEDIDKLHIKMDRFLYWLLGGLGAIVLTLLGTL